MAYRLNENKDGVIWRCERCGTEAEFKRTGDNFIDTIHLQFAEHNKLCLICDIKRSKEEKEIAKQQFKNRLKDLEIAIRLWFGQYQITTEKGKQLALEMIERNFVFEPLDKPIETNHQ